MQTNLLGATYTSEEYSSCKSKWKLRILISFLCGLR